MQAVESGFSASDDVEKLQNVIRQLEIQNAKLRSRVTPSKMTPQKTHAEKRELGESALRSNFTLADLECFFV